jgi:hypothetical protein
MGQFLKAGRAMPAIVWVVALVAPAFPASAHQESWRPASSNGTAQAYIDASSMRRDGDRVRFVREVRMGSVQQFEDGRRYDVLGALMEVDCRARTLRNLEGYARLGNATVATEFSDGNAEPVQPGSTADTDFRAACFNEWPR